MKKDRKISTQGTGKDENRVEDIRPTQDATPQADNMENAGIADRIPGEAINEGNQVTADIPVGGKDRDTSDDFNNNNTTNNYAQEVDVNTGGVPLEKSPGATNKGNNLSNADLATSPSDDREAIIRSVDEDAERQTGRPTGAIYGSGGDIISVSNPAASSLKGAKKAATGSSKKKAAPKQEVPVTRVYGQLHTEDNGFFLKAGNVPEGQIQLLAAKEIKDQLTGYSGQYVSIVGELSKKNKKDTYTTMSILKIASHDQIGQRAYELSQQNPGSEEEHWLQAENELLQQ